MSDDYVESGYSIIAREIYNIDQARNKYAAIKLRITGNHFSMNMIDKLRETLNPFRNGACKVGIEYRNRDAICMLDLGDNWRVTVNDKLLDLLRNSLGNDNVFIEYNYVLVNKL